MILDTLKKLLGDRRGATAVEYGLIVALIVIAMVTALTQLANSTTTMWGNVSTKVSAATAGV
ncbi:pilus assembly protein Flp/PilA [Sphingomonas sp. BE270]|jgi:pilus assembly protein Flp/PilA|uniref:Flp family type IVb pilin n=1 Tax=unclassified Sphingomonas TaxID=196159 RepID=UPI00053D1E59|nr:MULTISPECIES: Flp family type IVb pilin [unclassified Sphingomonas]MDR6847677.1 pilus assembly protein Flp/PilA [Sphingomonas sp. BE137]MDR7257708.1 pilus assembly protein Flp/PilA [Sphingomonas sp. BE270]RUN75193.1 Flp family type IVb pilin [Sphingomonas sp. TF3]